MSKFFTLQEAEEWLPKLDSWLRTAIDAKQDIALVEKSLNNLSSRIHLLGGVEIDPVEVAERRLLRQRGLERLKAAISQIEECGCLVKDLDTGLIDFPALLEGEEVYLCWKLGESRIEFWHRPEEGFAGRKRIGDEFGGRSEPDRPN